MERQRLPYFIGFVCIFIIEVLIALFVRDRFIRPYMGDVLVILLIYCFIRSIVGKRIKMLPLYIFIFAVAVEFLQYVDILSILNLQDIQWLRIVVGGTFDTKDIICYFAGASILFIFERLQSNGH